MFFPQVKSAPQETCQVLIKASVLQVIVIVFNSTQWFPILTREFLYLRINLEVCWCYSFHYEVSVEELIVLMLCLMSAVSNDHEGTRWRWQIGNEVSVNDNVIKILRDRKTGGNNTFNKWFITEDGCLSTATQSLVALHMREKQLIVASEGEILHEFSSVTASTRLNLRNRPGQSVRMWLVIFMFSAYSCTTVTVVNSEKLGVLLKHYLMSASLFDRSINTRQPTLVHCWHLNTLYLIDKPNSH